MSVYRRIIIRRALIENEKRIFKDSVNGKINKNVRDLTLTREIEEKR